MNQPWGHRDGWGSSSRSAPGPSRVQHEVESLQELTANPAEEAGGEDEVYAEEPSKFGAQVLPVADLPDDFCGEPQDGLEYLFTVRSVSPQLQDVTYTDALVDAMLRCYQTS